MKKKNLMYILVLVSALLFISSCSKTDDNAFSGDRGESVTWMNFNDGFKKALAEKKPMVIDFYADWCKWCKVMDTETFSDGEVAEKLKSDYVAIRIHTDTQAHERLKFNNHEFSVQEFSSMMGVQGLPTLVFMDRTGKPITQIPGFLKKDVFLPLLNYITEECYTRNVPFDSYMKDDKACQKIK